MQSPKYTEALLISNSLESSCVFCEFLPLDLRPLDQKNVESQGQKPNILLVDHEEYSEWFCFLFHLLIQFSSVAQSCSTLCDPMNLSTPGLPVHHQHSELAQTHVHQVGDAIQPSHLLLAPSPPAFNLSQHQGLFKWVSSFFFFLILLFFFNFTILY